MRTAVVKLGGEVLEGDNLVLVANGIREAVADGWHVVVVHGGGPQVTVRCKELGIAPQVVGGRRITDQATLGVVIDVLAKLGRRLCQRLAAAGVPASWLDRAVHAAKRPPRAVSGAGPDPIDFGLVGDVTGFDRPTIDAALPGVAVLPSLGHSPDGQALNVNADIVSSKLAAALGAQALVAVAAVGGVRRDRDDPATRIPRLTVAEARAAIADGTVQGGMIPKLEEAFVPLAAGVPAVHIVGPSEIAVSLRAPGSAGTLLVP